MRPPPSRHRLAMPLLAGMLLAVPLGGCGPPPTPPVPPPPPAAAPSAPATPVVPSLPPALPAPTVTAPGGFADDRAVSCAGRPDGDEIIALLRETDLLAADDRATVARGPLCAGTWQYAVVTVPDLDPLQVVTRGDPEDLELVTAGTDVCSVEVRVRAPSGIRVAADCVG